MKRLLLIVFLCVTVPCYGQTVDFKGALEAYDANDNDHTLIFAIHPDASDEYDGDLDQWYFDVLAPPAPPEGPYAYSVLPDGTELIEDWRSFGPAEDWEEEWKIVYSSVDRFEWTPDDFPSDPQDAAFSFRVEGGKTVNMRETSTYEVDSNSGVAWITASDGLAEITYNMRQGWNLIGLPLYVENSDYDHLFPGATQGSLYSWNGQQYESEGWLVAGKGYWIHFDQAQTYTIEGTKVEKVTFETHNGWTLVTPPFCGAQSSDLGQQMPNVYAWDGSYSWGPIGLSAGHAYWWSDDGGATYSIDCNTLEDHTFVDRVSGKRRYAQSTPAAAPPPPPPTLDMIEKPEAFVLHGNHPNPFNPSTTITFELPDPADVTLKVFDAAGRQVMQRRTEMSAGRQEMQVDGSSLQSGLYMYRLTAESADQTYTESGQMTLVK